MDKTTTIKSFVIMGVQLRGNLKPIDMHNSMVPSGSLIGLPLRREALASLTADVIFSKLNKII